ncbi:MAG: folylpolyglutamate synthase/dihydrofolate synthase family protein [Bacteroidales bacterium]|jgi:dihydrofolate synthase/folylpolyglutamate synthase
MTYKETLDYLNLHLPMYHRIGAAAYKADLNNTLTICNLLGNPQHAFRSVHIAGTNGKGSTSHMLASILQEKGLKTGLYTSPHLTDFRERIRINGIKIPEEKVISFVEKYKPEFEKIQPSFFEMIVGLAFDHFREEKVDIAIIEVGLGGRLDSTNIITPLLSVITNISFDHKQFLGDTLEKIAKEKAGIIKPGIPVVIGESQEDIRHVFIEKAREEQSEIVFADAEFTAGKSSTWEAGTGKMLLDIFRNSTIYLSNLESPLGGNYQKKNIVTVCAACEVLASRVGHVSADDIRRGILKVIKNTGFAGRWQILSRVPLTICDTGHNEAGLGEVLDQISKTPHKNLHFVFGLVNDKEIDNILQMLPKDATYYFCKADIPRGLDSNELRIKADGYGLTGESFGSVKKALKAARQCAGVNDLVFIGGSTFIVAEVV